MSVEDLIVMAQREAQWYAAHPRAKFHDRQMCCIHRTEASDTATLLQALADALKDRRNT